jgi:hypothetical protein
VQINSEQIRHAEAHGCRFQPASDTQVQALSMQRRIFWHGTQALVALREDGFLETAATLKQLLEQVADAPQGSPPASPAAMPEPAPLPKEPVPMEAGEAPSTNPAPPGTIMTATAQLVAAIAAARALDASELPDLIRGVHASVSRLKQTTRDS